MILIQVGFNVKKNIVLTHIVNTSWNNDICILFSLGKKNVIMVESLGFWQIKEQTSYVQVNRIPQKQAWQMLCTEWESAPGLFLGLHPVKL